MSQGNMWSSLYFRNIFFPYTRMYSMFMFSPIIVRLFPQYLGNCLKVSNHARVYEGYMGNIPLPYALKRKNQKKYQ